MVEIEYEPVKKVVVHELYRCDNREDLIIRAIRPTGVLPLYWSEGVLFFFYPMESRSAKRDYMKGTFHLEIITYCMMPEYKKMLEFDDENIKGVKVRVIDLSKFETFRDLAKWMKNRKG